MSVILSMSLSCIVAVVYLTRPHKKYCQAVATDFAAAAAATATNAAAAAAVVAAVAAAAATAAAAAAAAWSW